MINQLPCGQFVYGKFAGAARSESYTVIAKSETMADTIIREIRGLFNGCRPTAVELSSYKTTYAMLSYGEKIIFLRLDVVENQQSGNKFVLNERYVVVERNVFVEKRFRTWEILKSIPKPELIYKNSLLSDFLTIEKTNLEDKKPLLASELNNHHAFIAFCFLLNASQVSVSVVGEILAWNWLAIMENITPAWFFMNIRLLIGPKAKDWAPDLFINCYVEKADVALMLYTKNSASHCLEFEKTGQGYVNFLKRCLEADTQLCEQVLTWANSFDYNLFLVKRDKGDALIKDQIPVNYRINLARIECQRGKFVEEDLFWLWRNYAFTKSDINVFLPVLLSHTMPRWNELDFNILSDYIKNYSCDAVLKIILQEKISDATRVRLLMQWGQLEKINKDDTFLWVELLVWLAQRNTKEIFVLLIQLLKYLDLKNSDSLIKILKSIPPESSGLQGFFWSLMFWLLRYVYQEEDLKACVNVCENIHSLDDAVVFVDFFKSLKMGDGGFDKLFKKIVFVSEQSRNLHALVPYIFNAVLVCGKSEALVAFALSLKGVKILPIYRLGNDFYAFDARRLFEFSERVILSDDEKYVSAYIYLLNKVLYREKSQEVLTEVLTRNEDLFARVVYFAEVNLGLELKDFSASSRFLSSFSNEDQLRFLINYFITIPFSNGILSRLYLINKLLLRVVSIEFIDAVDLDKFLALLFKFKEWTTARKVLELQTRSAILRDGDNNEVRNKLLQLYKLVSVERNLSVLDRVKGGLAISYYRSLPVLERKEFLFWFLELPLSSLPPVNNATFRFMNESRKSEYIKWFVEDLYVRCCLFAEIGQVSLNK